jgi:hypothetical protein
MTNHTLRAAVAVLALVFGPAPDMALAQGPQGSPTVLPAVKHDTLKQPLREMSPRISLAPQRFEKKPVRLNPHTTINLAAPAPDPVLQPFKNAPAPPTSLKSSASPSAATVGALLAGPRIEGVGDGFKGPNGAMRIRFAPPDTNGAVGKDQYVQWVNTALAVFDKHNAAVGKTKTLYGPVDGNTIWQGFGGNCEENNDGDPIVQYDKLADRWILAQFSVHNGFSQCVAVSQNADATGYYHRYEFKYDAMDDYPKLAVWPDAYYVSFNMYSGDVFLGAKACAYDRRSMLDGRDAKQVCFQLSPTYFGLLPSDLDGATTNLADHDGRPDLVHRLWVHRTIM